MSYLWFTCCNSKNHPLDQPQWWSSPRVSHPQSHINHYYTSPNHAWSLELEGDLVTNFAETFFFLCVCVCVLGYVCVGWSSGHHYGYLVKGVNADVAVVVVGVVTVTSSLKMWTSVRYLDEIWKYKWYIGTWVYVTRDIV